MSTILSSFLELPDELLVRILAELDIGDLIVCSLTCRLLRRMIEQTAVLQYHINLDLAGLEDYSFGSKATTAEKLIELKTQQENWMNLRFRKRALFPMPENSLVWELSGGVMAHGISVGDFTRGLAFIELPSASCGLPGRRWEHADLGVSIRDFSMDVTQDLVVVVGKPSPAELLASQPLEHKIHLFSLNGGEIHPLAASAVLACQPCRDRDLPGDFVIQIMGDVVGILFHSRGFDCQEQLFIWNWKDGKLLINHRLLDDTKIESFTFLSHKHFVLSRTQPNALASPVPPELLVYDFPVSGPDAMHFTPRLVRCFHLPRPVAGGLVSAMTIRSDPSPPYPSPRLSKGKLFTTGPSSHVVAISIDIFQPVQAMNFERHSYVLFVHRSTLMQGLELESPSMQDMGFPLGVPWHRWGPQKSRILRTDSTEHTWVCYVHGSRYVTLGPAQQDHTGASGSCLRMLDFNPWPIRHAQNTLHYVDHGGQSSAEYLGDPSMAESGSVTNECQIIPASQPTTLIRGAAFSEDVTTSLPYRDIRSSELFDYRAVMIDEGCLVGLHRTKTIEDGRAIEALCF